MSSLTNQVLHSSFLLLLIRLIQRSIGLISTLILARVLTPDDFGIVAISALVVHFCDVLSEVGSQQYIIQKTSITKEDVNSAWTLNIILKSILWLLLIIFIPLISSFYDRPEIENVLYVSSLILIIGSFNSPGLILLRRDLQYKPIFKISIIQKIISFSTVMLIVYFSPTYWALIIGDITSVITLAISSYLIHPVRPKICFSKIRQQWSFSQWIILKGGLGFTRAETDTILISKFFSTEELGTYHISKYLSVMPSTDIIAPAMEPLLSSYARVKKEPKKLAYQVTLSLFVVCLLITPISVFMWFFPEKIIDFFLGSQWTSAYSILSSLSVLLFTMAIYQVFGQCCIALGKARALFIYDLLSLIFIFTILFTFIRESLSEFALLRGILGLIIVSALFVYIRTITEISIRYILKLTLPIFIASLTSAYFTIQAVNNISDISLINLLLFLAFFGFIYTIIIIFFYIIYYKNTAEGQHIFALTAQLLSKSKKIILSKIINR